MATLFATSPADGFEAQWQTNYLSQGLLIRHLLDTLVSTATEEGDAGSVRVVNLTSNGRTFAPKAGVNFDDLSQEKSGGNWSRYGINKSTGAVAIRTAAVHPGAIDTNLNRQTALSACLYTVWKGLGACSQPSEGAHNSLFAVASPDFKAGDSGQYFVLGQKRETLSKVAQDMELANRLWEWTKGEIGRNNLLE
ncbi:hypothetical protein BJX63DRAFT_432396 [Aspergillus granulosus]|uniref:Uncharacterized protein n=1 Tax=Aspergillus granulosus TaxID=176169 RepID=A0ABR4HB41_9EURO